MNQRISWRLALRNLKAYRHMNLPYILSVSLMLAFEYVMISLVYNDYVIHRHESLQQIMSYGSIIGAFFTGIFILYADGFYQKQRKQELGVYNILGLEKKHIRAIMTKEQIIKFVMVSGLALVGGQLIGTLMFLLLNQLMNDTGATVMAYPFSIRSGVMILLLHLAVQVVLYLRLRFQLWRYNPIQWLQQQKAGEKEPRGNLFLGLIGIGMVISGYVTANQANHVIEALPKLFIAVILVIIGTYLVLMTLSIRILAALKHNPRYYYQDTHFLTISGMLYRMKANAVSLASIAVLSTGVILVLGLTISLFRGMNLSTTQLLETDYVLTTEAQPDESSQEIQDRLMQGLALAQQQATVTDYYFHQAVSSFAVLEDQSLTPILPGTQPQAGQVGVYLGIEPLADYNRRTGQDSQLAADEVLVSSNRPNIVLDQTLSLAGQTYQVRGPVVNGVSHNLGIEALAIVVPDESSFESVRQAYRVPQGTHTDKLVPPPIQYALYFNTTGTEAPIDPTDARFDEYQLTLESRVQMKHDLYMLNGGLLYLGIIVSLILVLGTGLMLYYKQLSEGLSDQKNFQIMKRVGLEDSLIKQTIRAQILWIFVLPLTIAILHTLAASRLVFGILLGMIQMVDRSVIISSVGGVIIAFSLCYICYYWLTSRVYYRLVSTDDMHE